MNLDEIECVYVFYDVVSNVCEWCGVWLRLLVLLYPDSTSHWNHR